MREKTRKRYMCIGCGNELQVYNLDRNDLFPYCKICKCTRLHVYLTDKPKIEIKIEAHVKSRR